MSDFVLTFDKKPVEIKFTFGMRFKLISAGLFISDGLITEGASIERFCKCWSILLNASFDANDTEAFLARFNQLEAVNSAYIQALVDGGVLDMKDTQPQDSATDDSKKKETIAQPIISNA